MQVPLQKDKASSFTCFFLILFFQHSNRVAVVLQFRLFCIVV